jgi:hypothetical protein
MDTDGHGFFPKPLPVGLSRFVAAGERRFKQVWEEVFNIPALWSEA